MAALAELAGLTGPQLRAVFNGGMGMVAVVEPAAVEPAIELLAARGLPGVADRRGRRTAAGDARYVEEAHAR